MERRIHGTRTESYCQARRQENQMEKDCEALLDKPNKRALAKQGAAQAGSTPNNRTP